MSASPRRRSLLGRPAGQSPKPPKPVERRAVTAPLRIGPELRAAIAKGDPQAIEALEAEFVELDLDEEPTDRGPPGDVEQTLGEDGFDDDEDSEGERTSWVATTDSGQHDPEALALGVLPPSKSGLQVMEKGVPGAGHRGEEASDAFELDEPPSEEVRRDPRFHGIDFRDGRPASDPGFPIEAILTESVLAEKPSFPGPGPGKAAAPLPDTLRLPRAGPAEEPAPGGPGALVPILAAVSSGGALVLGGGGLLAVLVVAWVATRAWTPPVAPATEAVAAAPAPPEPVAAPVEEVAPPPPPAVEDAPEVVEAPEPSPVPRRRAPKPAEVVPEPEPPPPPPPAPVAAPEPPPPPPVEEDDKKGKKKKKK